MTRLDALKLAAAVVFILGTCWLTVAFLLVLAGAAWPPALVFAAFVIVALALS